MLYRFSYWFTVLTIKLSNGIPFTIYLLPTIIMFMFLMFEGDDLTDQVRLKYTFGVFGSMILHELGHVLMASLVGIKIVGYGFGGMFAYVTPDSAITYEKAFAYLLMALTGPMVNITLSFVLPKNRISKMNRVLGVGNLIPVLPYDGGRIVDAVLLIIGISSDNNRLALCFVIWLLWVITKRVYKDEIQKIKNRFFGGEKEYGLRETYRIYKNNKP